MHKIKKISLFFVVFILISCGESNQGDASQQSISNKTDYFISDVVKNNSFQYIVHGVEIKNSISQFVGEHYVSSLEAKTGSKFLVIDVEIKNLDNETRMINGGQIIAIKNSSTYKFEVPEVVGGTSKDFLPIIENINPLISTRGKVVFKVPDNISNSNFYWIPPRSNIKIRLTHSKSDNLPLSQLPIQSEFNKFIGKHPIEFLSDQGNYEFLNRNNIGKENLLKVRNNFQVASKVTHKDGFIIGEGCKPHECDTNNGIFFLNLKTNLFVLITYDVGSDNKVNIVTYCDNCNGLKHHYGNIYSVNFPYPKYLKEWLLEKGIELM